MFAVVWYCILYTIRVELAMLDCVDDDCYDFKDNVDDNDPTDDDDGVHVIIVG